MRSTHEADLELTTTILPPEATSAHIFPDLVTHSLVSIGQLCDSGCVATFDSNSVIVSKDGATVLTGTRHSNGLWYMDSDEPPVTNISQQLQVNFAYSRNDSITADQLVFLHSALFSPVPSTLLHAIKRGHLTTWPNLTINNVKRFLHKSIATVKGHLDQTRKNKRSTKTVTTEIEDLSALPSPPITDGKRTHFVYAAVIDAPTATGQIYTDQTGRFPVISRRGNKYIMVLYDYDSNSILVEPIKNRTDAEILRVFERHVTRLTAAGLKPLLQRLDNEASKSLEQFIRENNMEYQLVPPHVHRANAAKRAIRTFKNHFIAGLCSTDKLFPLNLWDQLLPQAEITLNLLRTSCINPKLSAYAQISGAFDYNATPLAPPGTKIVIHEKPSVRGSWAPHGLDGWYIGPALEHYRCYRVHVNNTNAERIGDTVEFFPQHVRMPKLSSADAAMQAASDLIYALEHPTPATPFDIGNEQVKAIRQLANIFQQTTTSSKATTNDNMHFNRKPALPVDKPSSNGTDASAAPRVGKPTVTPGHQHFTRSKGYANFAMGPNMPSPAAASDIYMTTNAYSIPMANAVLHPVTGAVMSYEKHITDPATKATWTRSATNEFGRLAQGVGGRITGTDTIKFISVNDVPKNRTVTYARFVCDYRPQKTEPERTRLTVGGNLIDYPGDVATSTADITMAKLVWNSVISTDNAQFMGMDIKNFYLNTPMDHPEYMRIHLRHITDEIIEEYGLLELAHEGFVYVEINKGMYGLPQAGILANKLLAKHLARDGYFQC